MKKSANFNSTTTPLPVFPLLTSNHILAQTHISVILEFVNEMHSHSSLPSTEKQPLNSQGVSLQPVYEEATTLQIRSATRGRVSSSVYGFS